MMNPFENSKETMTKINEDSGNTTHFLPMQTHHLQSQHLVNTVPRKANANKISQLIFIMEISNFTKHFLRGDDICIEEGNQDALFAWHTNGENLPKPIMLGEFQSFTIPPYTKERLIFRNSTKQIAHTRIKGV